MFTLPVGFLGHRNFAPGSGLVIIAGQSNAVGRGFTNFITTEPTIGDAYPAVQYQEKWELTPTDPLAWDVTNGPADLQSYYNGGTDGDSFGVELSLGRALDALGNTVAIAKMAIGGSSLAVHWKANSSTYPTAAPQLSDQLITFAQNVATDLDLPVVGVVWIQGEEDANDSGQASAYKANLEALVTKFRATFPDAWWVLNHLHTDANGTYAATVRSQQEAFIADNARTYMITADDLYLDGSDHFSADAYIELGYRFAAKIATIPNAFDADWTGTPPPPITWTVDGTSNIGVPADATEWDDVMAAVGVITGGPDNLWSFQQASSPLSDAIGSENFAVTGAGSSYQQAVTGWTRTAWKLTDGGSTYAGTPSNVASTTSSLLLLYVAVTSTPAAARTIAYLGGGDLRVNTTPNYSFKPSGQATVTGTEAHGTTVHPLVIKIDVTGAVTAVYTDLEKLTLSHGVGTSPTYLGAVSGLSADARYLYGARWLGSAAEISAADIKSMLETLGWTVSWTP